MSNPPSPPSEASVIESIWPTDAMASRFVKALAGGHVVLGNGADEVAWRSEWDDSDTLKNHFPSFWMYRSYRRWRAKGLFK